MGGFFGNIKGFIGGVPQSSTPPTVYLLDTPDGAGALCAYATMKLSENATQCIRVRRDIDNAEADIGFFGDGLDEPTLNAFISGSYYVYVTKFYDQSGNNNHFIQNTAINQTIIVESGTILKIYDKASVFSPGGTIGFNFTTPIATNDNFSSFSVINRLGTKSVTVYSSIAGTPYTTQKYSDNFYYTGGEEGYIKSNSTYPTDEPYYITGIYNSSVKKQYQNGVEIPSSYLPFGATFANPLTGTAPNGTGYLGAFILYGSDKTNSRTVIEGYLNGFFDIVQSGYTFQIQKLTSDILVVTNNYDSGTFFPISATELGLYFGYNPLAYTPFAVTDKFWTTSDAISFTEEDPLPVGPSSHAILGLRNDGLIWAFGLWQTASPGIVTKFYVCTLNPATKTWSTISSDVVGNDQFLQYGCIHKDYLYGAFSNGVNYVLRRSIDGLTWVDMCILPNYAVDSSMWSDGTRIRFAGGGHFPVVPGEFVNGVYESLNDGVSFTKISDLPTNMQSIWPGYILFGNYELYFNGAHVPTGNSEWGQMYFRLFGTTNWTKASTQNRSFNQLGVYPRHAISLSEWNNKVYAGLGTMTDTYEITLNN